MFDGRFLARQDLIARLRELGWLEPGNGEPTPPSDEVLKNALSIYQRMYGIAPTGDLTSQTERSLVEPRFCRHADVMALQTEAFKWPAGQVTWCIDKPFAGMDLSQTQDVFRWACDQWMGACGINLAFNPNPRTAHITASVGRIDGPASVLAWSQLANQTWDQKQQLYDEEAWVFAATPPRFTIDAGRVVFHELGHAIGIPHIEAGNMMQPTYDVNIRSPQQGDIREARLRYGPPVAPTPPPSVPAGTFTLTLTAKELTGLVCAGFDIRKL